MSLKNWALERQQWPWTRGGILESLAELWSVGWLLDVWTGRAHCIAWCPLPGGWWDGRWCDRRACVGGEMLKRGWCQFEAAVCAGECGSPCRCSAGMQAGVTVKAAVWGQDVLWLLKGQLREQKRVRTGGQGRRTSTRYRWSCCPRDGSVGPANQGEAVTL